MCILRGECLTAAVRALEMILMFSPPLPMTRRMAETSEPLRTKEAAMKSTALGTPHCRRSSVSFSVMVGRSTITPGRLQFLRSLGRRGVDTSALEQNSDASCERVAHPMVAVLVQRASTVPAVGLQEVTTWAKTRCVRKAAH